jgi:hypothetical protein
MKLCGLNVEAKASTYLQATPKAELFVAGQEGVPKKKSGEEKHLRAA